MKKLGAYVVLATILLGSIYTVAQKQAETVSFDTDGAHKVADYAPITPLIGIRK